MNENDYSKILIETKDLIMKKGEFNDWKPLYRNIWSRDESAKYMLWKVTKSEEEAKTRMTRTLDYQQKEKYALQVYLKDGMEPNRIRCHARTGTNDIRRNGDCHWPGVCR